MREAIMTYLRGIGGGFAWYGTGDQPDINFVIGGHYYGFYIAPSAYRKSRPRGAKRRMLKGIKAASGTCCIVWGVREVERELERRQRRYEAYQTIPYNGVRQVLRQWGSGDYRLAWLDDIIYRLPADVVRVLAARYSDKMYYDEIAREMGVCDRVVYYLARRGHDAIAQACLRHDRGLDG